METKLAMPVLALGGEMATRDNMLEAMQQAATNVSGGSVAGCRHYLPEECPQEITQRILDFLGKKAAASPHHAELQLRGVGHRGAIPRGRRTPPRGERAPVAPPGRALFSGDGVGAAALITAALTQPPLFFNGDFDGSVFPPPPRW